MRENEGEKNSPFSPCYQEENRTIDMHGKDIRLSALAAKSLPIHSTPPAHISPDAP